MGMFHMIKSNGLHLLTWKLEMGLAGIRSETTGHFFGTPSNNQRRPPEKGGSRCDFLMFNHSLAGCILRFHNLELIWCRSSWWFGTWLLFSRIYGLSSFPLTNSYFSRWLKPPISYLMPLNPMIFQVSMASIPEITIVDGCFCFCVENCPMFWWTLIFHVISVLARSHFSWCIPQIPSNFCFFWRKMHNKENIGNEWNGPHCWCTLMVVDARFLKIKLNYQSYIQKKHENFKCFFALQKNNSNLCDPISMVFGALASKKMFWL